MVYHSKNHSYYGSTIWQTMLNHGFTSIKSYVVHHMVEPSQKAAVQPWYFLVGRRNVTFCLSVWRTSWRVWLSDQLVTLRRARLILGWVTVCEQVHHFGM